MIKKYMKKPVTIDAVQWNGDNTKEIYDFVGNSITVPYEDRNDNHSKIVINTLEGPINASVDDFIIKGIKGEFYPCKPDIFEISYEEIV